MAKSFRKKRKVFVVVEFGKKSLQDYERSRLPIVHHQKKEKKDKWQLIRRLHRINKIL